jgi:hypothetical protein
MPGACTKSFLRAGWPALDRVAEVWINVCTARCSRCCRFAPSARLRIVPSERPCPQPSLKEPEESGTLEFVFPRVRVLRPGRWKVHEQARSSLAKRPTLRRAYGSLSSSSESLEAFEHGWPCLLGWQFFASSAPSFKRRASARCL